MKNFSQNILCSGRESNRTFPKKKTRLKVLPLANLFGRSRFKDPKVLCSQMSPPLVPVLSQKNFDLPINSISVIYILILSSGLKTCILNSVVYSGFPDNILNAFVISSRYVTCLVFA
jgi:hypothetical protein